MPSVLVQLQPCPDSTSGEGRIFSRLFNEYCAATTPTAGADPRIKRAARFCLGRGESRKCGRVGQKSRFHRHPTRPTRVDDFGREALRKCSGRPPRAGELLVTRIVETNGLGLWWVGGTSARWREVTENHPALVTGSPFHGERLP